MLKNAVISIRSDEQHGREKMFLTPELLATLTDAKRPRAQIALLREHGYKFEISRVGRPKVLIQEVENHLLSKKPTRKQSTSPRLDILDQRGAN